MVPLCIVTGPHKIWSWFFLKSYGLVKDCLNINLHTVYICIDNNWRIQNKSWKQRNYRNYCQNSKTITSLARGRNINIFNIIQDKHMNLCPSFYLFYFWNNTFIYTVSSHTSREIRRRGRCKCSWMKGLRLCAYWISYSGNPEEEAKHEQALRKWSEKVNEES